MTEQALELLGQWNSDPNDSESIQRFGLVTVEFGKDGRLTYRIHGKDKDKIILLTYSVSDGVIITNQPSAPRTERTPYRVTNDGRLLLIQGDDVQSLARPSSPVSL